MNKEELTTHILKLAKLRPNLEMPYSLMQDILGINRERLARLISSLRRINKVPPTFMPDRPRGKQEQSKSPYELAYKKAKRELIYLQKHGIKSLPLTSFKKILRTLEEEVLSD